MARPSDPLEPHFDHHPFRVRFLLPHKVLDHGWLTWEGPGAETPFDTVNELFALPGVHVVSLHRNEIAILRDPEVPWEELLPEITRVLRSRFLNQPALVHPEGEAAAGGAAA